MDGSLTGIPEMVAKIKLLAQLYPERVAAALYAETEIEATECKKRCPVWNSDRKVPKGVVPGALRATIHATPPETQGIVIRCKIVAGGAAGAYALRQHEELTWLHKEGQAKYIESVVMESRSYIAARMAVRCNISKLVG